MTTVIDKSLGAGNRSNGGNNGGNNGNNDGNNSSHRVGENDINGLDMNASQSMSTRCGTDSIRDLRDLQDTPDGQHVTEAQIIQVTSGSNSSNSSYVHYLCYNDPLWFTMTMNDDMCNVITVNVVTMIVQQIQSYLPRDTAEESKIMIEMMFDSWCFLLLFFIVFGGMVLCVYISYCFSACKQQKFFELLESTQKMSSKSTRMHVTRIWRPNCCRSNIRVDVAKTVTLKFVL